MCRLFFVVAALAVGANDSVSRQPSSSAGDIEMSNSTTKQYSVYQRASSTPPAMPVDDLPSSTEVECTANGSTCYIMIGGVYREDCLDKYELPIANYIKVVNVVGVELRAGEPKYRYNLRWLSETYPAGELEVGLAKANRLFKKLDFIIGMGARCPGSDNEMLAMAAVAEQLGKIYMTGRGPQALFNPLQDREEINLCEGRVAVLPDSSTVRTCKDAEACYSHGCRDGIMRYDIPEFAPCAYLRICDKCYPESSCGQGKTANKYLFSIHLNSDLYPQDALRHLATRVKSASLLYEDRGNPFFTGVGASASSFLHELNITIHDKLVLSTKDDVATYLPCQNKTVLLGSCWDFTEAKETASSCSAQCAKVLREFIKTCSFEKIPAKAQSRMSTVAHQIAHLDYAMGNRSDILVTSVQTREFECLLRYLNASQDRHVFKAIWAPNVPWTSSDGELCAGTGKLCRGVISATQVLQLSSTIPSHLPHCLCSRITTQHLGGRLRASSCPNLRTVT